jgi:hypothetical protein
MMMDWSMDLVISRNKSEVSERGTVKALSEPEEIFKFSLCRQNDEPLSDTLSRFADYLNAAATTRRRIGA